ncbi:MAG: hypothetical protein AAF560_28475, partial [Acidobacteriota bacterium]
MSRQITSFRQILFPQTLFRQTLLAALLSHAIPLPGRTPPADAQDSVNLMTLATAPVPRDHYLLSLTLTRNSRDER